VTPADKRSAELPDLTGQVALITGASRGLGRAVSLTLAACGANVVLLARDGLALRETQDAIMETGGYASLCKADVTDPDGLAAALAHSVEQTGAPSILVNCAATQLLPRDMPVTDLDPREMTAAFDTKVVGALRLMQAVAPLMRARGGGRIVNIGGVTLQDPREPSGFRNAALAHITRYAAAQWATDGISVTCVHPAMIAEQEEVPTSAIPAAGALTLRTVAQAIAHFCTPWSMLLSGESLLLGGVSAPLARY